MLFGPHDRLLLLQMFQTLLSLLELQACNSAIVWLLLLGLQAAAVFGTFLVDMAFSWLAMALTTVFVGRCLCPFVDPPPRCGYERPPRSRGSAAAPFYLLGATVWLPVLFQLVLDAGWAAVFDEGYGFVALLVMLQWWALGFAIALEKLRCTLERPPPWPDPPSLVPFGYARRWCKMSYPRHHRRFGQVSTYYLFDFPEHMPFVVALLGCWFAFAACLLGGVGDGVASLLGRRAKSSGQEKGSDRFASSSASSGKTASSSASSASTAPEIAVPDVTSGSQSECATISLMLNFGMALLGLCLTILGLCIFGHWAYRAIPFLLLLECCLALLALLCLALSYLLLPRAATRAVGNNLAQTWANSASIVLNRIRPSESLLRRYDECFGLEVWSQFYEAHPAVLTWMFRVGIYPFVVHDGIRWVLKRLVHTQRARFADQPKALDDRKLGDMLFNFVRLCKSALLSLSPWHQQLSDRLESQCTWMYLHPFKSYIMPFIQDYFDWVLLFKYKVWVPAYVDSTACNAEDAPQLGLSWRIRRHIKRVEAELRARGRHPDQFPSALPPPEPPPYIEEGWRVWFDAPWTLLMQVQFPQPEDTPTLDWWDTWTMPTWDEMVDDFVRDHNPSDFVRTTFLGSVPFGDDGVQDDKRKVTLPVGEARSKQQWRALLNYVEDPRCLAHPGLDGTPLIYDSGASVCISPNKDDFIS